MMIPSCTPLRTVNSISGLLSSEIGLEVTESTGDSSVMFVVMLRLGEGGILSLVSDCAMSDEADKGTWDTSARVILV